MISIFWEFLFMPKDSTVTEFKFICICIIPYQSTQGIVLRGRVCLYDGII